MNKAAKLFVFFLFPILILLIGCEKNKQEPIPSVDATLTASAVPDTVDFGGSSMIYYNSSGLIALVGEGRRLSLNSPGYFYVTGLEKDTVFTFLGFTSSTGQQDQLGGAVTLEKKVKITIRLK